MSKRKLTALQKVIAYGSLIVVVIWMLGVLIFFVDLLFKSGD